MRRPTVGRLRGRAVRLLVASALIGGLALPGRAQPAAADGGTFTGSVDADTVNKYVSFPFTLSAPGTITASVDWVNGAADLNLFLKDPSGTMVAQGLSRTAKPEVITYHGVSSGTYMLGVKARLGASSFTANVDVVGDSPGSVGDRAFQDLNRNGVQETGEPGLGAVGVHLLRAADLIEEAATVTAADGSYAFSGVTAGPSHILAFDTPTGWVPTAADATSDDSIDSDPDPATGRTGPFSIGSGATVTTWDAGYYAAPTTITGNVSSTGTTYRGHSYAVAQAGTLTVDLDWDTTGTDLNLFLKDPSGVVVASATSTTARPERLSLPVTSPGTYSIGVKAKTGSSDYTATVDLLPPPAPPTPIAYQRTVGGPAHPQLFPSGIDLDRATGRLFVADTGNDQVEAYDANGALLWSVGARTLKLKPGEFDNPRDVAYLDGMVYVGDTAHNRVQLLDAATGALSAVWSYKFGTILGISAGWDGNGQRILAVTIDATASVLIFTPQGSYVRTIGGSFGSGPGQLNLPRDAATDTSGNVYVADYGNDRIVQFGADGGLIRSWGVNGSGDGQFKHPYGVDLDEAGNVYVADSNNERVQEFTPTGGYLRQWGVPGNGSGQLFQMRRVAVGAGATPLVYAADLWGAKVQRFRFDGTPDQIIGNGDPPTGGFNEAYGLAVSGDDLFVADTDNQRFQRFSTDGAYELSWGIRGFGFGNEGVNWPRDITVSPATDTVWVADTKNFRLQELSRDGVATGRVIGGRRGAELGQFDWIFAVAPLGDDLVVADTPNNRIQRIDPEGTGTKVVWSTGGFAKPKDVAVANGIVYVADTENRRIVKLSEADGSVLGILSSPTFGQLEGIAISPAGDIWVADTTFDRLVQVSTAGVVLQTVGAYGTAHGQFNSPAHIEFSTGATGTLLWVADQWNDRVEVYSVG